jgi:NADH-quinone oxidoreductase subunit C
MSDTPAPAHPFLPLIKANFAGVKLSVQEFRAQVTLITPASHVKAIARFLRDHPECDCNFLTDIGGVDYLDYPAPQPARFAVVHNIQSHSRNLRIRLKTYLQPSMDTSGIAVDPALEIDSVCDIWPAAEWLEREVYDMFGIRFAGHPDLRRILLWKDYPAHPLRKDYPLRGRGEREHYQRLVRESAES